MSFIVVAVAALAVLIVMVMTLSTTPTPPKADPARIDRLERELGIGPYANEPAARRGSRPAYRPRPPELRSPPLSHADPRLWRSESIDDYEIRTWGGALLRIERMERRIEERTARAVRRGL